MPNEELKKELVEWIDPEVLAESLIDAALDIIGEEVPTLETCQAIWGKFLDDLWDNMVDAATALNNASNEVESGGIP